MSIGSPVENEMKRIGWRAFPEVRNLTRTAANDVEAATAKKKIGKFGDRRGMILSMTNFEVMFALGGATGFSSGRLMTCPNQALQHNDRVCHGGCVAPAAPATVVADL